MKVHAGGLKLLAATSLLALLAGSVGAKPPGVRGARRSGRWTVPCELVYGIMNCEFETTWGRRRLIVDTGSMHTDIDRKSNDSAFSITLGDIQYIIVPSGIRSPIFADVVKMSGKKAPIGIVGNDALREFDIVGFDYTDRELILLRRRQLTDGAQATRIIVVCSDSG